MKFKRQPIKLSTRVFINHFICKNNCSIPQRAPSFCQASAFFFSAPRSNQNEAFLKLCFKIPLVIRSWKTTVESVPTHQKTNRSWREPLLWCWSRLEASNQTIFIFGSNRIQTETSICFVLFRSFCENIFTLFRYFEPVREKHYWTT